MNVRVRMPPSPTGYLHIGTARTALFNWLFAKKHNGKLILRIEDTDTERSKPEFEKDILEQLEWLGLKWDEGPFRQSERTTLYAQYLTQLLEQGYAYYCACAKEQLEAERQSMLSQGIPPRYQGACRDKQLKAGEGKVIRFRMPDHTISFTDMIRGKIDFRGELIGDFVIAKSSAEPLYNFTVVVDDLEMKITHVIRGEDHLPNTPKQIALLEALGHKHPHYAHLPLILDPGRSKMSKRSAATAITEYRAAGYVPEAIINFIALLGWHPAPEPAMPSAYEQRAGMVRGRPPEREIFSIEELILLFNLERVQKAGAVFSIDKLNWMNAQYIRKMHDAEILKLVGWELSEKNIKIIELLKNRAQTLNDFKTLAAFFFEVPPYNPRLLQWKKMKPEEIIESLQRTAELIKNEREGEIPATAEKYGRGETFWPLRAALSGQQESPGPLEILTILGPRESLRRITIAIEKLSPHEGKTLFE